MTAYTTIFSAPPNVGNFLVDDTMACPVDAPVQNWVHCGGGTWAPAPVLVKRFPNWPTNAGCLLASLAASSTAARTGGVVTVTATAHGVTTGTAYVGYRLYYPGSTNLTAGWYDSILSVPDANTIRFSEPGPDFTSESVNGGAAWTTITTIASLTHPGGTLRDGGKIAVNFMRGGDATGTTKTLSCTFGGTQFATIPQTVNPNHIAKFCLYFVGRAKQVGVSGAVEAGSSSALLTLSKDIRVDQDLAIKGTISAASSFLVLHTAFVEIL
jgi:hypothetical protein